MEPLSDILQKTIKRHGLSESVFASILIKNTKKFITDNMGFQASKFIKICAFKNNIIQVKISSAVWAQEFHFHKHALLDYLREMFPEKNIMNIQITIAGKEDLYDPTLPRRPRVK
jgi:hypothetical protein